MKPFDNVNALIIDMDGVLWHGNQPVSELKAFFSMLRQRQVPFVLATNNASSTQDQYVLKLARMGVTVESKEILTSGMATALYLTERYDPKTTRVFVLGEEGAREPLIEQGFTLTGLYELNDPDSGSRGADIVVCGKDETLNWEKLATATLNIRAGAQFIATNGDVTMPTERGLTHGNGAILAALEAATDVTPITIGKPEPIIYQQALAQLGVDPTGTVAIGDRLDTDILGAVRAGIRSLMVLTGISSREDLETVDYQPTWIMQDLGEVIDAFNR